MLIELIFPVLMGICFIYAGIRTISYGKKANEYVENSSKRFSEKATGTIVDIVEVYKPGDKDLVPEVKYSFNGQDIFARPIIAAKPCPYQVGQSVDFVFDPSDPQNIWIAGPVKAPQNLIGIITTWFGLIAIFMGVFCVLLAIIAAFNL